MTDTEGLIAGVMLLFALFLYTFWPENAFARLVIEPTRRIVERVHRVHPDTPVIGFPRGIGARYEQYFVETGINALSIDADTTLDRAKALASP